MQIEMTVILCHKHPHESGDHDNTLYTAKLLGEVDHGGFLLETTTKEETFKLGGTYTVTIEGK